MLRLTENLWVSRPGAEYADFYGRALRNHILASIDPEDPGCVYFTPLRPQYNRVYSQPEETFWCCVGTGMENPFGRLGSTQVNNPSGNTPFDPGRTVQPYHHNADPFLP